MQKMPCYYFLKKNKLLTFNTKLLILARENKRKIRKLQYTNTFCICMDLYEELANFSGMDYHCSMAWIPFFKKINNFNSCKILMISFKICEQINSHANALKEFS